jgi:hypothetical protein
VPTPTATPADAWVEASSIASDHYTEIAMVVDPAGVVHAAGAQGGSIWYLTDGSGAWTRDRLSNPPGPELDREPAIAGNGESLAVAFTRYRPDPFGTLVLDMYLMDRDAGGWSTPAAFGVGDLGRPNQPSIQARGGNLYIAYRGGYPIDVVEDGDEYPIRFATNESGSWVDVVVSPNGSNPSIALTGTGQARIVFGDDVGLLSPDGLRYARQDPLPSTDFSLELVPETGTEYNPYALAHDGARAHLVYCGPAGAGNGLYYARRTLTAWGAPELLTESCGRVAVATDAENNVHVVLTTQFDGVWYFTNRHGSWESKELLAAGEWYVLDCAIDVDPSGRAHILFVVGENRRSTSLWYAVSPAS